MSKLINFYDLVPKDDDDMKYYNPNKLALQHPFRVAIVGSTSSMKTNSLFNVFFSCNCIERVYIIAKLLDEKLYRFFINVLEKVGEKTGETIVTYSNQLEDIPKLEDIDKSKQNLVIVDDMMSEKIKSCKELEVLFTMGRKRNVSVAILSQSWFRIPITLRGNCNYYILKQIKNKKQIKAIVDETALDMDKDELYSMYKKAIGGAEEDFFMIDLQTRDPKLRYRRNFEPLQLSNNIAEKSVKKIKK